MTELRKCSRCGSEIELRYFSTNRKGEYNKTCDGCLNKMRQYNQNRRDRSKQMRDEIQWNKCLISSDDDEEVKEIKSMLAIKTIGIIQMY